MPQGDRQICGARPPLRDYGTVALLAALQDRHGLAFHEFAQRVDAAQLEDGIAYGGFRPVRRDCGRRPLAA